MSISVWQRPNALVSVLVSSRPDGLWWLLRWHAEDFVQRSGFTYTVLASGSGRIIGCVSIHPSDGADGVADVCSWV